MTKTTPQTQHDFEKLLLNFTTAEADIWAQGDGTYRVSTTDVNAMYKINAWSQAYKCKVRFTKGDEPVFAIKQTQLVDTLMLLYGLRNARRILKRHGFSWLRGRKSA